MPQVSDSVAHLLELIRFPSVSTQPEHAADLTACAQWLVDYLTRIGLSAAPHPTGGHPVVVAKTPVNPAKRTVLIYGHYDVQPAEPLEEWQSPAFEPEIRNGRIYARGSTDNKGQIFAHIT
ncbi:MAG TPA: M20/M25/M40 family metallo-hydrolase, partial [Chthoniobacterales bacterium]